MVDYKHSKYSILRDYIESGSNDELSDDEFEYLNILTIMEGMRKKYGRTHTINFFKHKPYNISDRHARRMYDEAINLFFADDGIEKKARRNMMADDLERSAQLVLKEAKDANDMKIYGDLMQKAYVMRELHISDAPEPPKGLYDKPIKIYELKTESIGLASADRREIARMVDELPVSVKIKNKLNQDAGVKPIDIKKRLNEQEEEVGLDA